jgi:hypothetical protein
VTELLNYLRIIAHDYEIANEAFMAHVDWQREKFNSGTREMTADEIEEKFKRRQASQTLHLRIDTFYVFAKILLDQVGPLIEACFGQGRATSLERHSKLTRNLEEYAQQRGLTSVPQELTQQMNDLGDVVEYRDIWITHDASPRTVKSTIYDPRGIPGTRPDKPPGGPDRRTPDTVTPHASFRTRGICRRRCRLHRRERVSDQVGARYSRRRRCKRRENEQRCRTRRATARHHRGSATGGEFTFERRLVIVTTPSESWKVGDTFTVIADIASYGIDYPGLGPPPRWVKNAWGGLPPIRRRMQGSPTEGLPMPSARSVRCYSPQYARGPHPLK